MDHHKIGRRLFGCVRERMKVGDQKQRHDSHGMAAIPGELSPAQGAATVAGVPPVTDDLL
jgi:hypothetical protein